MARRRVSRRKLTEPCRWNVLDDAGLFVGTVDLHPSLDMPNRFHARVASFPGAGTLLPEGAAYRSLWGAARAVRGRVPKDPR